jgi:hypothetical protein
LPHSVAPLGKHVLEKSAGGNEHVVMMTEFNDVS